MHSIEKRHRLWPKIVATVVVLAVLYVLSPGPIAGFITRVKMPDSANSALTVYLEPMNWLCRRSPKPVVDAYLSYLSWWFPEPPLPVYRAGGSLDLGAGSVVRP